MAINIKWHEGAHWYRCRDGTGAAQHDADLRVARKELLYPSISRILKDEFRNEYLEKYKMEQLMEAAGANFRQPHEDLEAYCQRIYEISLQHAKKASDFGSDLHDAIEHYPQYPLDPTLHPWLTHFAGWYDANVGGALHREKVLFDHDLGLAGRCDFIGSGKGQFTAQILLPDYKGLALETKIPTPVGWTTMADLQVGDMVFGSDGKPCRVIGKGPVFHKGCYRIEFDDTSSIVCDCDHLWRIDKNYGPTKKRYIVSANALFDEFSKKLDAEYFKVANASPLSMPDVSLPMDPYFLGAWLGDGTAKEGKITLGPKKIGIVEYIRGLGFEVRQIKDIEFYVMDLVTLTKRVGVFGNKHVPAAYLRASQSQRLELLRGLMDTDGSWNHVRNQAVFVNTNKLLSDAVYELAVSLGWRASRYRHTAHGFGTTCEAHTVFFTPFGMNPFRFNTRNQPMAEAKINGSGYCRRRLIKNIVPIESVPTQCISVNSPDNTYLCGEQMVPTHNTQGVKVDKKGKKKPAFYDSWVRQLAFYAVTYAKEAGLFPDNIPTCISLVFDSTEPSPPYEKVWTYEEVLDAYEDVVIAAYRWFKQRDYYPAANGKIQLGFNIQMPK